MATSITVSLFSLAIQTLYLLLTFVLSQCVWVIMFARNSCYHNISCNCMLVMTLYQLWLDQLCVKSNVQLHALTGREKKNEEKKTLQHLASVVSKLHLIPQKVCVTHSKDVCKSKVLQVVRYSFVGVCLQAIVFFLLTLQPYKMLKLYLVIGLFFYFIIFICYSVCLFLFIYI